MSVTYTSQADFALGFSFNLDALTNPGELDLQPFNYGAAGYPWLWFATGVVECMRYNTDAPTDAPYRFKIAPNTLIAEGAGSSLNVWVDLYGNCWFTHQSLDDGPGAINTITGGGITKVGMVIGGTRCDVSGVANPLGLYLKPPFTYNSGVIDRDGDGLLRIFNPASESSALAWINVTDASGGADARTVDNVDDSILVFQRTSGGHTRHVCTQLTDESVWVVGYTATAISSHTGGLAANRLDNLTGQILDTITPALFDVPATLNDEGGYQGFCVSDTRMISFTQNRRGFVSTDLNTLAGTLGQLIAATSTPQACCVDRDGNLWFIAQPSPSGGSHISAYKFNGTTLLLEAGFPVSIDTIDFGAVGALAGVNGVVCDFATGNLWTSVKASTTTTRVIEFRASDGVVLNNSLLIAGQTSAFSNAALDIDQDGKLWLSTSTSAGTAGRLYRINMSSYTLEQTVVLPTTSDTPTTLGTGFIGSQRTGLGKPQGFWRVVYDFGSATVWGTITWSATVPGGCSVVVEYRVAPSETGLPNEVWTAATSGVAFSTLPAQFIEVRVTMGGAVGGSIPAVDLPVLHDLTIDEVSAAATMRLGQSGIEFLYTELGGLSFVPVPELRVTQVGIEYLYSNQSDIRVGQVGIEFLWSMIDQGPPNVGCGTGLVSFIGGDQGSIRHTLPGPGAVSFVGGDQGQVSCTPTPLGVVSFVGGDQGQIGCP